MISLQILDVLDPFHPRRFVDQRIQPPQHVLDIAHYGDIYRDALADLRGIHVHMHHLGIRRECRGVSCDAVVESHAQGDEQVGLIDRQARIGHSVHAWPAGIQEVILGKTADAQEGRDDRNLCLFCQFPQLVIGPRQQDPMSGKYHRPLGAVDQLCSPSGHRRMTFDLRLVSRQIDAVGVVEIGVLLDDILGDIDQDWPRSPRRGYVKSLFDGSSDVARIHDEVVVLGDGQCDAGDIGLLKGVRAYGGSLYLAGDYHHGNRIHLGGCDSGHEVGGSRPGCRPTYSRPARHAGISVGGMGRSLFVTCQDVTYLGVLRQCLVEGQDRTSRQAENDVDPLPDQAFANYLTTGLLCHVAQSSGLSWRGKEKTRPLRDGYLPAVPPFVAEPFGRTTRWPVTGPAARP